jgi:hypothetical protein
MTALRYISRSACSAALGLVVIGLGMEAWQMVQMYRGRA